MLDLDDLEPIPVTHIQNILRLWYLLLYCLYYLDVLIYCCDDYDDWIMMLDDLIVMFMLI